MPDRQAIRLLFKIWEHCRFGFTQYSIAVADEDGGVLVGIDVRMSMTEVLLVTPGAGAGGIVFYKHHSVPGFPHHQFFRTRFKSLLF